MAGKPQVSLALVGPMGCGKTTLLARLCSELGAFPAEEHQQCQDLAWELGRPSHRHGWMLDRLPCEREEGTTVMPTLQMFKSQSCVYSAFDTPGREDLVLEFVSNFLSITSLADAAVMVVSAASGEWEMAVESGRARELALDCFTMGIKTLGSDVPVIPVAGLSGENLVSKSAEMPWYAGHTAIESLDALGSMNRPAEKPLRLPVLKVHDQPKAGTVVVGRIETGSIRIGIKVIFSPSGLVSEVRSIYKAGEPVNDAREGDIVSVGLGSGDESEQLRPSDIRRGMVISGSTDPAADAETFLAQVVVLNHPGVIRAGYCPAIAVHTAQVPCEFEELLSKVDRKTGKDAENNPTSAKTGDVVTVKMRPRALVCVETFSAYPPLGRFAIRDHGRTVGVGVIKEAPNSRRTISTHCTVGSNGKPSFTELLTLAHLERPGAPEDTCAGSACGAIMSVPRFEERYSLVALKLHTGRTHQIRVHMQSIGHPLITDTRHPMEDAKYAEDRLNEDKTWCPRNFLHTYRLAFRDVPSEEDLESSGYGPTQELISPLPSDLREALALLKPVDASSQPNYEDWLSGDAGRLRRYLVAQGFKGPATPCFATLRAAVQRAQEQWPAGTWEGEAPLWVVQPSHLEAAPAFLSSACGMARRQTEALQAVMDRAEQIVRDGSLESRPKKRRRPRERRDERPGSATGDAHAVLQEEKGDHRLDCLQFLRALVASRRGKQNRRDFAAMAEDARSFEIFLRSELDALQTRLLAKFSTTQRATEIDPAKAPGWLGPSEVCGRSYEVAEQNGESVEELQPQGALLQHESTPLAEAMGQVMPDETALFRTSQLLASLKTYDCLEGDGDTDFCTQMAQETASCGSCPEDDAVQNPKALVSWAMLLDQMGMHYDLNFGAAVTGNSILQPEKPRAESELDMNIRPMATMRPSKDPAMMRVGVNLGSAEEEEKAAKVAVTMHETMVRTLNLARLVILGSPVVVQSCFIHSAIYAVVGVVGTLEQAFYALGLKELRWAFLRLYPEAASWNGNHLPDGDACSKSLLGGDDALGELAGANVLVKWTGNEKFLMLDSQGWATPGPKSLATVVTLQPVYIKGQQLADTYTLQLRSKSSKWGDHWLACTPVNHLRVGGWLRAFRTHQEACPFKLVQDSSCPMGTCKMLSTWPTPPQQEPIFTLAKDGGCMPAGFYLVDQFHGGRSYVGQAPDVEASHFELILAGESAWTTPLSKKGSMVLKQVSAKHTVSATQEEDDDQSRTGMSTTRGRGCLDRLVLHPYKAGRVSWGLLTLIVVAWEAVAMPLLLFDLGDLSVALSSITSTMLAFWIVDICINCITGVDRGGVIDLKLKTAFREYATSWMVPDLLIVALDVVVLVAVSEDSGETPTSAGSQGMRLARALRLLRLIRLLRIYKASSAANFLVDYIRSPSLLIASKIAWTLLTILFINHYIACGWCAIAYFNVDGLTWILASNLEHATFTELYLSSLHWSLTQFSPATNNIAPQNVLERSVAAFVVIFALLVFSSFVSSITNHMNQLRITNARMIEEDMQLRNFFEKRMISVDLSGRIQHLFKKGSGLHMRRPHIGDIPFLKEMPESLRIHLHNELYMKHFYDMPVFSKIIPLDRSLFSKICHHAFEERFYPASFEVFVDGSNAKFTIINVNGDLDYSWMQSAWDPHRSARGVSHATTLVKVPLGAWLAEAALWSDWTHRGLLESVSPSEILLLDVSSFTYQCHNHGGPVYNLLRRVAVLAIAYREQLSRSATAVTDLPLHEFAWKNILERGAKLQTMNTVINAMTRASFLK
eukprot:s6473_g1.t2